MITIDTKIAKWNIGKAAVILLLFFTAFQSCQRERVIISLNKFEQEVFQKISQLSCLTIDYWDGFDYLKTSPIYLVVKNEGGQFLRGFILNPHADLDGNQIIKKEDKQGLEVYRNDDYLIDAKNSLGIGDFSLDFSIEGSKYLLLTFIEENAGQDDFYFNYKNRGDNYIALFLTHELFHFFQIKEWQKISGRFQDIWNFPFTQETLALALLMYDLTDEAHLLEDKEHMKTFLKYYVAIRREQIKLDVSREQYYTNMANAQETIEGTARYIEHFSALNTIYPEINADPTHAWRGQLLQIRSAIELRRVLAFRNWYHTGSAVAYVLKKLETPLETETQAGKTLFEIAEEYLNCSPDELESTLQEAISISDWEVYKDRAVELFQLL